ncbi:hypothetical protein ACWCRD_42475 [Streptomyces sp. NPDC002092]
MVVHTITICADLFIGSSYGHRQLPATFAILIAPPVILMTVGFGLMFSDLHGANINPIVMGGWRGPAFSLPECSRSPTPSAPGPARSSSLTAGNTMSDLDFLPVSRPCGRDMRAGPVRGRSAGVNNGCPSPCGGQMPVHLEIGGNPRLSAALHAVEGAFANLKPQVKGLV